MNRGTRIQKSERARTRRKKVKQIKENVIQKLYNKLRRHRNKINKIKKRHHDGKL